MNRAKHFIVILCVLGLAAAAPAVRGQAKQAITFDDLIRLDRISAPQVSPDGKWVAYKVATPDKEANRSVSNIWLVSTAGGEPRQLTRSGRDSRPEWSPDSSAVAFLSARDGAQQVYVISTSGGEATQLTHISTGADNVLWSPDGQTLAFTSEVYADCRDDACNSQRDAARAKSKVKARIYDHLLYRHWNRWSEGRRSHLFAIARSGGVARDLTPGANYDVPPFSLSSPDGKIGRAHV